MIRGGLAANALRTIIITAVDGSAAAVGFWSAVSTAAGCQVAARRRTLIRNLQAADRFGAIGEAAIVDVAIGVKHLSADGRAITNPGPDFGGAPGRNNGPSSARGGYAARVACATDVCGRAAYVIGASSSVVGC